GLRLSRTSPRTASGLTRCSRSSRGRVPARTRAASAARWSTRRDFTRKEKSTMEANESEAHESTDANDDLENIAGEHCNNWYELSPHSQQEILQEMADNRYAYPDDQELVVHAIRAVRDTYDEIEEPHSEIQQAI